MYSYFCKHEPAGSHCLSVLTKDHDIVKCLQVYMCSIVSIWATQYSWYITDSLICGHCDKGFANERLLRDHVRQHGEFTKHVNVQSFNLQHFDLSA